MGTSSSAWLPLDELDLHCLLIDLFQKPVTKRIMNLERGANDMGGGLPMNHLPHPCFIRVHRWLRINPQIYADGGRRTDLIEDNANDDLAEGPWHAATITEESSLMNRAFSAGSCAFVTLGRCPKLT
jgi:hypothetical protein